MPKQNFLTESDIDLLEQRFREIFLTVDRFTEFKSDLFDKLDSILKEVKNSRDEQTVLSAHSKKHTDQIEKLKKIHPNYQHAPVL